MVYYYGFKAINDFVNFSWFIIIGFKAINIGNVIFMIYYYYN